MKSLLLLGFGLYSLGTSVRAEAILKPKLTATSSNFEILAQANSSSQTAASPLVRAAKELLSLERYELESVMQITGDIPGTSFTSDAEIKTIVEAPNKFNSQITFVSPNGLEGKAYDIVSDGSRVWIYDYATNQYSVSDLDSFLQTRESFLVGALSYFYLNTRSNIGSSSIVANFLAKLPEDRLIDYFQRFSNLNLENSAIADKTIEGRNYKVYEIDATVRGFKATAYIDSEGEYVERVNLSGTKDDLQLATKEQMLEQNIPESFSDDTFSFEPPDDAEPVEQQIIITPF